VQAEHTDMLAMLVHHRSAPVTHSS